MIGQYKGATVDNLYIGSYPRARKRRTEWYIKGDCGLSDVIASLQALKNLCIQLSIIS